MSLTANGFVRGDRVDLVDGQARGVQGGHGSRHGIAMPQLTHGGPGRADGGAELGGLRALHHYLQRTAVRGHPDILTGLT